MVEQRGRISCNAGQGHIGPDISSFEGMSVHGTKRTWIGGQSMSALPQFSDVDLLGYGKRIVQLDP
jgi:hypothetical protein